MAVLAALALAAHADVQTSEPARELPPAIREALAPVGDFVMNIDQPGVLAVFEFVKRSAQPPGYDESPIEIKDWRDLLERPSDLRGRVVAIEGLVGRNKDPYTLVSRPELGLFGQIELRRDDQPLTCTVICTTDTAFIPIGATARFVGYFVMIRNYRGASGREQQAALVVATGPQHVTPLAPSDAGGTPQWAYLAGAIVLGLVITIVLLRQAHRGPPRDVSQLRAERAAPLNLAAELDEWAKQQERRDRE